MSAGQAAAATTASYSYDPLGRVLNVAYSDCRAVTYAYDNAGNRTKVIGQTPPGAVADSVTTTKNNAVIFDPTTNDQNLDNDTLTVTIKTAPSHGSASVAANNQVTYTPNTNYTGTDTLVYKIADRTPAASGCTDTATVTITVN